MDRLAPELTNHGQHSRLGKIKILITHDLCGSYDHFRIDLVSLHDVNEPWRSEDRPKGPNKYQVLDDP